MRSNLLALIAGLVAAFFYTSIFFNAGLIWPLVFIPLFMLVLAQKTSTIALALASAGAFICFLALMGLLPPGSALKTFSGLILMVGIPVTALGSAYKKYSRENQIASGEPLLTSMILITFALFSANSLLAPLFNQPLHIAFTDATSVFAEVLIKELNAQASITSKDLAHTLALQMAGIIPVIFIFIQGICLRIARRLLVSFGEYDLPPIRYLPVKFPFVTSFVFFISLTMYLFVLYQFPHSALSFYLSPIIVLLALPLALQGYSLFDEKFLKTLSQFPKYSVYMVILVVLVITPIFTGMIFVLVGMLNQLYISKTEH